MIGLAQGDSALAALFDGSPHGPVPIAPDEASSPAALLPEWIVPLLAEPLRDRSEQAALLDRAPLDLRVNRIRGTVENALAALPGAVPITEIPGAIRVPEGTPVEQTAPYRDGLVEIQDAGSQTIIAACAARPGMTVIDLCAGAGGKTLGLAADMNGVGRLIAADVNRDRLSRLAPRAARAGAGIIETLLLDGGREHSALAPLRESADIVLVDAPCSGTGTWRRNPEARWRLTPDRLGRLVTEQARILDIAAPLVRRNGRLVYAVCSLAQAEGAAQVDAFLRRHDGWAAVMPDISVGRAYGKGHLLTPAHDGTDGFFIAALVRI